MTVPLITQRGALRLFFKKELDYIFIKGLSYRFISIYSCFMLTTVITHKHKWDRAGQNVGWGPVFLASLPRFP